VRCKLYDPNGGGVKFFLFSKVYSEFSDIPKVVNGFQYPQGLYLTAWANKGTSQADIHYRVRVTKDFCNFVNKKNGITADIHSFSPTNSSTRFVIRGDDTSNLAVTNNYWAFGGASTPAFNGKNEFCHLYRQGSDPYQYIYTIFVYPY
jgi:hypothetical protein